MVHMPHWPLPFYDSKRKYDLERISLILDKLGNPQDKLPPTIHIAGTNGKGSTLAFLEAIFKKAGYKAHKYTSPHLLNFNERIVINNKMIDNDQLYYYTERVRSVCEEYNIYPTFFEGTTAIAFLAFSEIKSDILLLETGVGGRIDPTNIVTKKILNIIGPISYDHTEYLGNSLKLIAGEKAGIITKDTPCIISNQTEEVSETLFDFCARKNVDPFTCSYDFSIEKTQNGFKYLEKEIELDLPMPSLAGDHQILNASTAIAGIMRLKDRYYISNQNIIDGITSTKWPSRLEKISSGVLYKNYPNADIWIDGAHNPDGARMLANWLEDNHNDRDIFLIIGLTKGRDIKDFINPFKNIAKNIYGILVQSEPSAYSSSELKEKSDNIIQEAYDIEDACNKISTKSKEPVILITGSLYLLGDLQKV